MELKILPELREKKKRDPTPCKSKKLIGSNQNVLWNESNKIKDLDMTVAMSEIREEISKKDYILTKLEHENKSMKMEIDSLEKQMKVQKEKITKLCEEICQLNLKLEESEQSNIKLEEVVLLGEQNLANAKSSLDKIKKSIKETRTLDLKKENEAYKNQIEIFIKSTSLLEIKIKEKESLLEKKEADIIALKSGFNSDLISYKEIFLENEIQRLKGILGKTEEEKLSEMFKYLKNIEQEKDALRKEVERLNIQLDYIFRVHFEEIKIFAKAKSDELTKQKKKYKDLQEDFESKKKEWEQKLLERETRSLRCFQAGKKVVPHSSILSTDESSRKFSISFSLSPE